MRQSPGVTAGDGVTDDKSSPALTALGGDRASTLLSAASEPASGQIQLTPGVTVVVLELLNDKGAVTATIPSAQQLAAYRNGTAIPPA